MTGRQLLELGDQMGIPSECELSLRAFFDREQSPLLELHRFGLRKRLEEHIGERRTSPERERVLQAGQPVGGIAFGQRLAAGFEQPFEAVAVELVRIDAEPVAGCPSLDPVRAECPAQPRDVVIERVPRACRGPLAPEPVDQPIT